MVLTQKFNLKDLVYILSWAIVLMSMSSRLGIPLRPKTVVLADYSPPKIIYVEKEDHRTDKLKVFLESKHSPLAPYSALIIAESDRYALDWTEAVAISKIESDYGRKAPEGSYNAWGVGGSNFIRFSSWEEGIRYISRLLGTSYKQAKNEGIKYSYCPASSGCNPQWAKTVTFTSKDILSLN